jgi:hypothetical protein
MVDETETTFGSEHHRMDEYVFSARRILTEGEKPKLELVIENPRVGLLSPLRKQWCWFAWDSNWGGTPNIIPQFFGRIVGIPSDLQAETLTITFIAWPSDYVKQLQVLAETLKIPPFYDPVFTDVGKRDDPMSIFESHSKLICVDPVTHVVSASDILDAEDGNVDFTADDHFYNSLHVSPGAVPKTVISVDASVSWTQTARGYVDMGNNLFTSWSGDGILNEWPKPLASIGSGLTVFTALAVDVNRTADIVTSTFSGSYQNQEKHHNDGDTLSFSFSWTVPQIHGSYQSKQITFNSRTGLIDPFAVDGDGDPSPTNIGASVSATTAYVPMWTVRTSMTLEYQAARPHTERIIFRLFANVQPTTLDPNVSEDSETITISGSDVGVPIIDLLNWTTISGTHVDVGTVIFPNDPQLPGGRSAQVATVAGTAGTVEPDFSDVVGEITIDGGVTWASLGVASPTESAADWTGVSNVPTGTTILPRRPIYTTYAAFTAAGRLQFPPVGTPISEGTILQDGAVFKVCTVSGTVGAITGDTATLVTLPTLPDGKTYFIATTGGTTGAQYVIPNFNNTLHATTADNTVVWTAIGSGDIPVGGTPGNVTGSTYFGQDRGHRSIEHLICRARTRLRYASRAVTSQFQCSYLRGTELTLRKSATLHDYRLPGGLILGKVTGIEMVADGGTFSTNVTIQSSVGFGETVTSEIGDPTFVADGYVAPHYQVRTNVIVLPPTLSDVGYSPLVPIADEDGIRFPLEKNMLVVSESFIDNGGAVAVGAGLEAMRTAAVQQATIPVTSISDDEEKQRAIALTQSNSVTEQLKRHPSWYDLVLKPINGNGAFNHVYHIKCTTLALPKMIDMQEESTS